MIFIPYILIGLLSIPIAICTNLSFWCMVNGAALLVLSFICTWIGGRKDSEGTSGLLWLFFAVLPLLIFTVTNGLGFLIKYLSLHLIWIS